MMLSNRLNYILVLVPLLNKVSPYQSMRPLCLMVHGLADVVKQAGFPSGSDINANLASQHPCQMRDFETVKQDVLPITGPKLELAKQLNQFRM